MRFQLSVGTERFLGVCDVYHGEFRVLCVEDRRDFDCWRLSLIGASTSRLRGFRAGAPARWTSKALFRVSLRERVDAIDERPRLPHPPAVLDHGRRLRNDSAGMRPSARIAFV